MTTNNGIGTLSTCEKKHMWIKYVECILLFFFNIIIILLWYVLFILYEWDFSLLSGNSTCQI